MLRKCWFFVSESLSSPFSTCSNPTRLCSSHRTHTCFPECPSQLWRDVGEICGEEGNAPPWVAQEQEGSEHLLASEHSEKAWDRETGVYIKPSRNISNRSLEPGHNDVELSQFYHLLMDVNKS